jgi:hypothetical protein
VGKEYVVPDPFWSELEAAYNAVSLNPTLQISVERGDKTGTVKYLPDVGNGVVFIKIEAARVDTTANVGVELNPAAKKEVD